MALWARSGLTASCSSCIPTITRHVHGFLAEVEVIVDLHLTGAVALADRKDAVRTANARRSDVKKILKAAALHFEELVALWEGIHGKASGDY